MRGFLLVYKDSNLERLHQKQLCYHYTIDQYLFASLQLFCLASANLEQNSACANFFELFIHFFFKKNHFNKTRITKKLSTNRLDQSICFVEFFVNACNLKQKNIFFVSQNLTEFLVHKYGSIQF